jgi:hypothetical protein
MKTPLQFCSIIMLFFLLNGCSSSGGAKSNEKGAFCQTKPSNAICSLPGPYKPVPVGTSCSCTHSGPFGSSFEVGEVINP